MPTSRAVIFDLDGTLVDSRQAVVGAVVRGVRECLQAHGESAEIGPEAAEAALGLPALEYFRELLPARLHHLAPEALARSTRREVEALAAGEGRLYPGVLEGLARLQDRRWNLAVISNAQLPYFAAALEHLRLGRFCAFTLCQEQLAPEADPRPHKERLLARALEALRAEPARTWMVGDRGEDLAAGRRLGCRTAAAAYGFGTASELAPADLRIDAFEDLISALESER